MTKLQDVFFEMACLQDQSELLNGLILQKKWFKSADKRYIGQTLQKFITYNSDFFTFLKVQPILSGSDSNISLAFRSNEFIGSIPLRSSDTGKQIGDFVVRPRFTGRDRFEDYIEILNLLDSQISPQIIPSLPLASGRNFRPPMYLEAIKYISILEKLIKTPWRKFDVVEVNTNQPLGQINWNRYLQNGLKPENRLNFPMRKSVLSELHLEYSQIRYVFNICKDELLSFNTPKKINHVLKGKISYIEEKLYFHKPVLTNSFTIKYSDAPIVKACKIQGNNILRFQQTESTAWRVDFSDVFEKFVQHIFKEVAKETGGRVMANIKFQSRSSKHHSWELRHVEPDVIYQKEDTLVFIDAKYKANLYNKFSTSPILKDEHRRDLHQILAYASFNDAKVKFSFLCYPSNKVEVEKMVFTNPINGNTNTIFIAGFPLKKQYVSDAKKALLKILESVT